MERNSSNPFDIYTNGEIVHLIASLSKNVRSSRLLFFITATTSLALLSSRLLFSSWSRCFKYAFHRSTACFVLSLGNLCNSLRHLSSTSTSSLWNPLHSSVRRSISTLDSDSDFVHLKMTWVWLETPCLSDLFSVQQFFSPHHICWRISTNFQ